jgi:hypothetical protein
MDEDLKKRFLIQKIQDFNTDSCMPFPTVLCEMENIKTIELVRKFCLLAMKQTCIFIPATYSLEKEFIEEELEINNGRLDFGNLYILVNVN